ncbi:MAG: AMP-binding protein [Bacteroidales bacterium]|nr:AMP-binding protein [Bacteroidales bacterium]
MKNIPDYLFDFAQSNPDKPALLHPDKISFSGLCLLTNRYAAGFQDIGITQGMKTIVLVTPGVDFFAITFALLRIGAVPVMIDPGMGNKAMAYALSKTESRAFIGIPKAHLLRLMYPHAFRHVEIFVTTGFSLRWQDHSLKAIRKSECFNYEICHAMPSDVVAVFFTSGSTGPAKAVIYQNRMIDAQIKYLRNHFNYKSDDIDLCTFPLIGLLVICLGLSIVLADMDMTHPLRLKPDKLIMNIEQFNCSSMFCSPLVLRLITDYCIANKLHIKSLTRVLTAGAPVSPALLRNIKRVLPECSVVHTPFGSTEALSVTDAVDSELLAVYGNSENYFNGICVGYPLKGIRLKIIKITDNPVETIENVQEMNAGEVGEIVVNGPNVTQSYLADDWASKISKIAESNSSLLWHRTGDVGKSDENGRIWYFGRKSQRVETGTGTLFTIPCEAVFNQHPAVFRSALVGIKSNSQTEPVICIELKAGIKKSEHLVKELLNLAQENKWTKKVSTVLFHKNFPVDPRHNAKIFREKLSEWAKIQLK